ncbi:homoserine dehydrogenase [Mycoavidus sp. B2-EB]|uniref:homoserine dehydrogenase n=1 Tax=Mycoavidus sp. B2-EB TaxID=2651972 RepID=UPI001623352D|nr:homoserine dehydrogenase [Mycoavidus sp. B2-EB]BBO60137.1 homoserine dehydrogenase [Mycoavidus sp. B2-EB]
METIKTGLLGFGTVGQSTFAVLQRNQGEISRRAGRGIEIKRIAVRDSNKARAILGRADSVMLDADAEALVCDPALDIVIETIGGTTIARELVLRALANRKHVVTANKALLAVHGAEIFAMAHKHGVMVAFEAAVAGGIPIIKILREGLSANRIQWIVGIINGTTNFILSEMREHGIDFETALERAQRLGYAEADPTMDLQGIDAAHKIALMSALAFGTPIQFDRAYIEGIKELAPLDIQYAEELGYRIKLLGIARRIADSIELRVHPTLVPIQHLLANVEGAMNAVVVHGDTVGSTLYYGKGAGGEPTASAVVADLIDVTRLHTADQNQRVPPLAFQPDQLSNLAVLPISEVKCRYYLRLRVMDVKGVLANITKILADNDVSIDALLQKKSRLPDPVSANETDDLIVITHLAVEKQISAALEQMGTLTTVMPQMTKLRIETLNEGC